MILVEVGFLCFLFSFVAFAKLNMHVLSLLISLEALMLSIIVFLYSLVMNLEVSSHFFLILLVFAASEAAMGLSLLVSMLRLRGNDYVTSLNSLSF
uniref:NADH-ubiquinone oxidoreductase chain 4L n=1 Tax=Berthellina sp. TLT-2006 TaxID=407122 RepID=E6Y135_9GAST|nr:NADH dehydrogenase subunit 4L [Berthellina sp. TLT-2006]ABK92221.1 NADH dehydrogenase subunit 4L [Berthellina sp. TLT-2006]